MQYLKVDVANTVTIGPAVAVGDGFTPVTGLVGASADEYEIIKHGATTTTGISAALTAITGADGYYSLVLSAAEISDEGRLTLLINDDSLILPIRQEFMVVAANVFDSLFAVAGTDTLQADLTQMGGVAQSATDLKDFADDGYDPATNKVQGVVLVDTTTVNSDMRGTDGVDTAIMRGTDGVDTATMRGTNSALLAASAPTNFGDLSIVATTGLVDVTQVAADKVWLTTGRTLTAFSTALALSVWDVLESAIVTASSIGLKLKNSLADTGEPGQGAPPVSASSQTKIDWLFKNFRNKKEQTTGEYRLYDNAGSTVDSKATVSDAASVTTKEELASGP